MRTQLGIFFRFRNGRNITGSSRDFVAFNLNDNHKALGFSDFHVESQARDQAYKKQGPPIFFARTAPLLRAMDNFKETSIVMDVEIKALSQKLIYSSKIKGGMCTITQCVKEGNLFGAKGIGHVEVNLEGFFHQ